jgi:hypothetical protein
VGTILPFFLGEGKVFGTFVLIIKLSRECGLRIVDCPTFGNNDRRGCEMKVFNFNNDGQKGS